MSKIEYPIFYKEATPVSLNTLLLSSPHIKENWKLIPTIVKQLNLILQWNIKDNGKSSITRTKWENRFGDNYAAFVRSLEEIGIITVTRTQRRKYTRGRNDKGKCYDYLLTPLCHSLLADNNKEYLHLLLTDKSEKRKIQKAVSRRGYSRLNYGDIRDEIKATIDGIELDWQKIMKITSEMSKEKAAFTYHLLVDIVRRDYGELKHNEKDNRIWNPFTQLPAEIKAVITINGLSYQQTIDIRSCYPSLWAEYLCAGKQDLELNTEREKYNHIFMTKDVDPKTTLANILSIDRSQVKEILIQYYNGKRFPMSSDNPFYRFNEWLKREFPLLFNEWIWGDISQTGNNIGKYWETKLMLDNSIYRKAKELGIVIGYEYDGMSFYAADNNNCRELCEFIENKSVELLGVRLVFVNK